MKVGATDAVALGPFMKQVHDHGREKRNHFSVLVTISLVGTISEKSLKVLPPDVVFQSQNAPNSISVGALPLPQAP